MSVSVSRGPAPALLLGLLMLWAIVAIAVGASGVMARIAAPPPVVGTTMTVVTLVLLARWPGLRERVLAGGPAPLVALHLTRFVGIYFLVLYGEGRLPYEFAVPGGWGDIAVAAGALGVLLFARPFRTAGQRRALAIWNGIGLADILLVVGTAIVSILSGEGTLLRRELTQLPLCLLPTFLVPLIIASHFVLIRWVREASHASTG